MECAEDGLPVNVTLDYGSGLKASMLAVANVDSCDSK